MPTAPAPRARTADAIAWTGTAVFGASLLWFLHTYLIGLDARPQRTGPLAAVSINVALFSAFALHHSLLARTGAKQLMQRFVPPELERSTYTWVASLLFAAVCTWWQHVPGAGYTLQGVWRVAGYAAQAAGIVLTLQGSAKLDVLDLAGVRQVQRARGRTARPATLETAGLYGFVRHPLYFAWALLVFGAPDMTATRLTFAVVSTAYLVLAIRWEERSLVHTFGPEYDAYRRRVRWRMMPFVY